MPRSPRYTVRAYVDITPATKKQLDRLAAHHETSVPQLIRSAIATAHGLPSDQDRVGCRWVRNDTLRASQRLFCQRS